MPVNWNAKKVAGLAALELGMLWAPTLLSPLDGLILGGRATHLGGNRAQELPSAAAYYAAAQALCALAMAYGRPAVLCPCHFRPRPDGPAFDGCFLDLALTGLAGGMAGVAGGGAAKSAGILSPLNHRSNWKGKGGGAQHIDSAAHGQALAGLAALLLAVISGNAGALPPGFRPWEAWARVLPSSSLWTSVAPQAEEPSVRLLPSLCPLNQSSVCLSGLLLFASQATLPLACCCDWGGLRRVLSGRVFGPFEATVVGGTYGYLAGCCAAACIVTAGPASFGAGAASPDVRQVQAVLGCCLAGKAVGLGASVVYTWWRAGGAAGGKGAAAKQA